MPMHAQFPMHNPPPMQNVYSAMPPAVTAMQQPLARDSSPLSAIFKAFQSRTSPPPSKSSTPPPGSRGLSPARSMDPSGLSRLGHGPGPKVKTFNPKMFEPEELRRFVMDNICSQISLMHFISRQNQLNIYRINDNRREQCKKCGERMPLGDKKAFDDHEDWHFRLNEKLGNGSQV